MKNKEDAIKEAIEGLKGMLQRSTHKDKEKLRLAIMLLESEK